MSYMRAGILLLVVGLAGCGKGSPDPAVVARVNGRNILQSDIDRQFRLQTQTMPQKPSGDAANLMKLEILRQLIVEEIMLQKAEELKLQPSDAELETEFTTLKGNATPEEFKKTIEQRGWNEEDLRKEIRRNLTIQKLVQDQLSSKIQVSPEEISRYYEGNKDRFYVQELEYHIGQIVVSANPDLPVVILRKDKARNEQEASQKIQMLTSRLQGGEDFEQLAREYSEDPQTAPQGGDMGFHPVSTFNQLSPQMKDAFMKMKVGDVSSAIQTTSGYLIFKLMGKREPGQLPLQDPEVNQGIRQELESQKQQLLSTAYSENLRNEAQVENFLVRDLVAGFQKRN
ncbi:MAG: SurA N-terminal domain-containing protein [Acidobacteria bacterium]|nr:SurA N-terminal domain-containing protein [Acidobacteriota bacterium]